jgi:pyruvate formate lyase activating enzyme
MQEAVLYQKLENNKVRCLACSWKCLLAESGTGICGVRFNEDGKLYSAVYGRAVGMHLDPMEKKPLYHFLPTATVLSFGTLGCNFGCSFCQNWEISQPPRLLKVAPSEGATFTERKNRLTRLIEETSRSLLPKEIVEKALEIGSPAIAYTYNEPAVFAEYAHDTAKLAKERGLLNVYVSNGFESEEGLNYIAPYLDAINIDLKSFNPAFYTKVCQARLEPVLATIKRVYQKGIHLEITTLVIPTLNDSAAELKQVATFIKKISPDIPWHVTAFYPQYKLLDQPPTPVGKLEEAWAIGQAVGLNYVYVGNVPGHEHNHTFCPVCHRLLIERAEGYLVKIVGLDLKEGWCQECGTQIKGVFDRNFPKE